MAMISDAPWVRDAELNGIGYDGPEPKCPICGEECDVIFLDGNDDPWGCECCISRDDIVNWMDDVETDDEQCPVCGENGELIYTDMGGTVCGCDRCVFNQDAWDWVFKKMEQEED